VRWRLALVGVVVGFYWLSRSREKKQAGVGRGRSAAEREEARKARMERRHQPHLQHDEERGGP
jgi:hypothetical protein